ncbi:hypothetical protein COEX109129_26090 [Corallococcus exiguus]
MNGGTKARAGPIARTSTEALGGLGKRLESLGDPQP